MDNAGTFPGLTVLAVLQSTPSRIEDCTLLYKGVKYLITRTRAKVKSRFIIDIVSCGDHVIYNHDISGYPGVAHLTMTSNGPIIALCKDERVQRIIPLVNDPCLNYILEHAETKREAAQFLGYKPLFTDGEQHALDLNEKIKRISQSEEGHRKRIEDEGFRRALYDRVMNREYISVSAVSPHTNKPSDFQGVPVLESECSFLRLPRTVIIVDDLLNPRATAREVVDLSVDLRGTRTCTNRRKVAK